MRYIKRFFCFNHKYLSIGNKFIGLYLPSFMNSHGMQEFLVMEDYRCKKCGKKKRFILIVKGNEDVTRSMVEKEFCK